MELMQAIATHTKFNKVISSYVARPDRSLESSQVGAPDRCDLGRWIYGEGRRYSGIQEFSALVASHAHYHHAAAEIVSRADAGQAEIQETELGSASEIGYASAEVVRSLMFLHGKLAAIHDPTHSESDGPHPSKPKMGLLGTPDLQRSVLLEWVTPASSCAFSLSDPLAAGSPARTKRSPCWPRAQRFVLSLR